MTDIARLLRACSAVVGGCRSVILGNLTRHNLWHEAAAANSVRTVPAGANVVAVGVIAAAAVCPGRSGSDRSGAHRSCTDTIATIPAAIAVTSIASGDSPAPHCDSAAAPRSSNCDSAAAVGSATAPIAATSATASIGVVGSEGD